MLGLHWLLSVQQVFCLVFSAVTFCLRLLAAWFWSLLSILVREILSFVEATWFNHYMDTVVRNIERANNYAVQRIPVGIAVFDKEGKLQWKNKLFMEYIGRYVEDGDPMSKVMHHRLTTTL